MSRLRLPSRRSAYRAGLASLFVVAALAMSGCITFTLTSTHLQGVFNLQDTRAIVDDMWSKSTCDQDINRNGAPGDPNDRSLCAFYLIRGYYCNNLQGGQRSECYRATQPDQWQEFHDTAVYAYDHGNVCIAFDHFLPSDAHFWWDPSPGQIAGC